MVKDKHDGMTLRDDIELAGKNIIDNTGVGVLAKMQLDNEGIWDADIADSDATEYSTNSNTDIELKFFTHNAVAHQKHLMHFLTLQVKLLGAGTGYITVKVMKVAPPISYYSKEITITNTGYEWKSWDMDAWCPVNTAIKVRIYARVDGTNTIYVKEISDQGATVKFIEEWVAGTL